MAVSGLPEPCTTHARDIARLALDMMELREKIIMDDEPVVIINSLFIHTDCFNIRGYYNQHCAIKIILMALKTGHSTNYFVNCIKL